jgi:predicted transcriptional regulator
MTSVEEMAQPAYQLFLSQEKDVHANRRSEFEVRLSILRALKRGPKRISRLMAEVNTSYNGLKSNLGFMTKKQLTGSTLKDEGCRHSIYFITKRGMLVVQRIWPAYLELVDPGSHDLESLASFPQARSRSANAHSNSILMEPQRRQSMETNAPRLSEFLNTRTRLAIRHSSSTSIAPSHLPPRHRFQLSDRK